MSFKATILLAEDDENLGFVIKDRLSEHGFDIIHEKNGIRSFEKFFQSKIDLCLIDVMMPGLDGFSLAQNIREKDELVPIIFLTAKSMAEDKLRGFEIGGDDYVTKPFSMDELIYRINVFLRRQSAVPETPELIQLGKLNVDLRNLVIGNGKEKISLTQMEADLLKMLIDSQNKLIKREDILIEIWGENDYFKGRSLDVFISRLRKYLKLDPKLEIRNHHGVGFTLYNKNLVI